MNVEQKKRGPKRPSFNGNTSIETNHFSNKQVGELPMVSPYPQTIFDHVNDSQLQFDADFVSNFAIDPSMDLSSFVKPSKFNPVVQQQPIQIDPVVLNYYKQMNPKLDVQQELDLFFAATLQNPPPRDETSDLIIAELPGIPSGFYLHLISMFFTYYHKGFPVLDETIFFENLIPNNRHNGMLLNTIYAIGCRYSRSPHLYQTPFFTPQKAHDYFLNRALALTPAPETWQKFDADTISICQASLLLVSCDFHSHSSHWMLFGMAIRQILRFEMNLDHVNHDFLSISSSFDKFKVNCSQSERKRFCRLIGCGTVQ